MKVYRLDPVNGICREVEAGTHGAKNWTECRAVDLGKRFAVNQNNPFPAQNNPYMDSNSYKVNPSTGMCEGIVPSMANRPPYNTWDNCVKAQLGTNVTTPQEAIEAVDPNAAVDSNKKLTRNLIIAGSIVGGVAIVATVLWAIFHKKAPVAAPAPAPAV